MKEAIHDLQQNFPHANDLQIPNAEHGNSFNFKALQLHSISSTLLASFKTTGTHSPLARTLWKELAHSSMGSIVVQVELLVVLLRQLGQVRRCQSDAAGLCRARRLFPSRRSHQVVGSILFNVTRQRARGREDYGPPAIRAANYKQPSHRPRRYQGCEGDARRCPEEDGSPAS